jgi:hypothetical protein
MTRALVIEGSGNLWGLSARSLIRTMPYNGRMSALGLGVSLEPSMEAVRQEEVDCPKIAGGEERKPP